MTYEGNCRLGDLFTSRREKGRPGLPTLSVTLHDGLVNREDLGRKQETNLTPDQHLLVKPGDIAYNMMRMWQGAFGLADVEGMVSPAYVVLKPKSGVDARYASYLFESRRSRYLFWAFSYGLTDDRLRLYSSDFKKIPAMVAPFKTQLNISRNIAAWDSAIRNIELLMAKTAAIKKALTRQLVLGHSRLGGFSKPWKKRKIIDMGRVVSGGTPDTEVSRYWGGAIPWATPADVYSKKGRYITKTERSITELGVQASSATVVPAGSLLVCTRATVGELAIASCDISTNQGFKNLIPSEEYEPEFLYYLFGESKRKFLRLACGSTFLELSKRDFQRVEFYVPNKDEQKAISECIASVDDQLIAYVSYWQSLNDERTGLIERMASGLNARGLINE